MKVFVKIKVLKSQGVKCKCTYGVTIPREYLQVVRWWQRWCLRIQHCAPWGSLRPSSPTSTRNTYRTTRRLCCNIPHRAHCHGFGIPVKEIIPVYSHSPRRACNLRCKHFRIQNNYCDLQVCGAFLRSIILDGSVRDLLLRCGNRLFEGTTDN